MVLYQVQHGIRNRTIDENMQDLSAADNIIA
jgi:hypothetical protein